MSLCIVYLASPREARVGTELRLTMLRSSIQHTRRCFPTTDLYVFHEEYTEEDKASLPGVTAFLPVDFRGHEARWTGRAPYGYLMMCRFFSGIVQSHPQIQRYTHMMRLDDDSFFLPPDLTFTPELLQSDYILRSTFVEARDQQPLLTFTLRFLERHLGLPQYQLRLPRLLARLTRLGVLRNGAYSGKAPYNNFHIASLRMWSHPVVRAYLEALEEANGILGHGWMDANVHAMIIYVLAEVVPLRVTEMTTFGYRHNVHVSRLGSTEPVLDASLPFFPPPTESARLHL
jgi:hypothetical protein